MMDNIKYEFSPRQRGKSILSALAFVAELQTLNANEEYVITRHKNGSLSAIKRLKEIE